MSDALLHRPAPELVSDEVLTAMERDGWTPTQVRELIRGYRALARDVVDRRECVDRILALAGEHYGTDDDVEYTVTLSADLLGNGESYDCVDVSSDRDPLLQLECELQREAAKRRALTEDARRAIAEREGKEASDG